MSDLDLQLGQIDDSFDRGDISLEEYVTLMRDLKARYPIELDGFGEYNEFPLTPGDEFAHDPARLTWDDISEEE